MQVEWFYPITVIICSKINNMPYALHGPTTSADSKHENKNNSIPSHIGCCKTSLNELLIIHTVYLTYLPYFYVM